MGVTPKNAIPYPELSEPADVPADMKEMADKLDGFGFVPAGAMFMWPGNAAPAGFLLMQGQTDVPAASNPVLAGLFGATGGFVNMPDLRDTMLMGASATKALLAKGGEATVKLTTAEMPAHTHADSFDIQQNWAAGGNHQPVGVGGSSWQAYRVAAGTSAYVAQTTGTGAVADWVAQHDHGIVGAVLNAGGDGAHNNLPPYIGINYIIRGG